MLLQIISDLTARPLLQKLQSFFLNLLNTIAAATLTSLRPPSNLQFVEIPVGMFLVSYTLR